MRFKLLLIALAIFAFTECKKPANPSSGSDPQPEQPSKPDPSGGGSGGGEDTPPSTSPYFKANIQDTYFQGPTDTGFTIYVDTNITDWTAEASADWLKVTKKSAEAVFVPQTIEQGSYPAPRTCTVTIKAGSVFNKTFTVLQEAWTHISAVYEVKLKPGGETVEIPISHNCYNWTPSTDANWLTVKKKDTATLTITSSARSASETTPRKGVVKLQSQLQDAVYWNITVSDADSNLGNEDYNYEDPTEWD